MENCQTTQSDNNKLLRLKTHRLIIDCSYDIGNFLTGGSENGQFIQIQKCVRDFLNLKIVSGDFFDIATVLEIGCIKVSGFTLYDAFELINEIITSGGSLVGFLVTEEVNVDLKEFLAQRFDKESDFRTLQQTVRENLYKRTVPYTTRSPREGEVSGEDYNFITVEEFMLSEKKGDLLETGIYRGHFYGTPKPAALKWGEGAQESNSSNSVQNRFSPINKFDDFRAETENLDNLKESEFGIKANDFQGEFVSVTLVKTEQGFGFTIIGGSEKYDDFLQIKSIVPGGAADRNGQLRKGDVLMYINDTCVLGYSHTDVVKIFQAIQPGQATELTVCRGYPLAPNDPSADIVSFNAVKPQNTLHRLEICKGAAGFGFTIIDCPDEGQRIKQIIDAERCKGLMEGDLLVSVNGINITHFSHLDVVELLKSAPVKSPSVFEVSRAKTAQTKRNSGMELAPGNAIAVYGRSKTPMPSSVSGIQTLPQRSKTPSSAAVNFSYSNGGECAKSSFEYPLAVASSSPKLTKAAQKCSNNNLLSNDCYTDFSPLMKSSSMLRVRSKTPGPNFARSNSEKAQMEKFYRSKTPTAEFKCRDNNEFSSDYSNGFKMTNGCSNKVCESNSFNSLIRGNDQRKTIDLLITLHLLKVDDGFGFRVVGGKEEGSQVMVGYVVPGGVAYVDGRLKRGDEIIMIDGVSVIGATHQFAVDLIVKSKQKGHVVLCVRRELQNDFIDAHEEDSKYPFTCTLNKSDSLESFGFVIISSVNKGGSVIGKIIENSPTARCGSLQVGDRILAVNGIEITNMPHNDVVSLIKESGRSITLTIGPPWGIQSNDRIVNGSYPLRRNEEFHDEMFSSNDKTDVSLQSKLRDLNISKSSYAGCSSNELLTHRNSSSAAFGPPLPTAQESHFNHHVRALEREKSLYDKLPYHCENITFEVELPRAWNGYGFSIRGGQEFNMPLFVLKLAPGGPAYMDGRLSPGDQILEINHRKTDNMSHQEAISLIKHGGRFVHLLLKRTGLPPPTVEDVQCAIHNHQQQQHHYHPHPDRSRTPYI